MDLILKALISEAGISMAVSIAVSSVALFPAPRRRDESEGSRRGVRTSGRWSRITSLRVKQYIEGCGCVQVTLKNAVTDIFTNPGYLIALTASCRFQEGYRLTLHVHGLDHGKIGQLYASILQVRLSFCPASAHHCMTFREFQGSFTPGRHL